MIKQTLASYRSPKSASSLKTLALPTKPLRTTLALVGKAYCMVAGQAGAWLHTRVVLQAYQADLHKELNEGVEVGFDDIEKLHRAPVVPSSLNPGLISCCTGEKGIGEKECFPCR